jgi:BirA family biotin operon repressor/biotin-[acetyl-CoA-carboxylase] ligase
MLTKSLKEGTVILASCQQQGRGQGQASWESEKGKNLTFSIVLHPWQVEVARQFDISRAISLGLYDFLSGFVRGITVKWPNDLYAGDKKIGGILIETAITSGKFSRAIVGIGLNINQEEFVSDAPNPVSLLNLTGQSYPLPEMLSQLCEKLDTNYSRLISGENSEIVRAYDAALYRRGTWAGYSSEGVPFEGFITGTDAEGCLLMETRKEGAKSFRFKEVQFL